MLYDGDKEIATKLIENIGSIFLKIFLWELIKLYLLSMMKDFSLIILFEGRYNREFMTVNTMPNSKYNGTMIDVNFFQETPHDRFPGEIYAGVEIDGVDNEKNEVSFDKIINGDSVDVFDKKLLVNLENDKIAEIRVTHVEANDPDEQRLFVRNIIGEELSDFDHTEANFIFSENGLVNLLNQGDVEEKLERIVVKIGDSYLENKNYLIGNKLSNDLYWLIMQLSEEKQATYLEKYDAIL